MQVRAAAAMARWFGQLYGASTSAATVGANPLLLLRLLQLMLLSQLLMSQDGLPSCWWVLVSVFCGLPTSLPLTCPLTSTAQHTMRRAPLPGRPPATCRHVWPLLWAWAQYRCAGWVVHLAAPWAAGLGYAETSVLRCAARCCCRGWDCFPGSPHCPRQGCQLRPTAGFGPHPQLLRSSALHAFDTCIQYNSTNCRQGVLEGWYNKQKVEEQEAAAKGEPCLGCCCLQLLEGRMVCGCDAGWHACGWPCGWLFASGWHAWCAMPRPLHLEPLWTNVSTGTGECLKCCNAPRPPCHRGGAARAGSDACWARPSSGTAGPAAGQPDDWPSGSGAAAGAEA